MRGWSPAPPVQTYKLQAVCQVVSNPRGCRSICLHLYSLSQHQELDCVKGTGEIKEPSPTQCCLLFPGDSICSGKMMIQHQLQPENRQTAVCSVICWHEIWGGPRLPSSRLDDVRCDGIAPSFNLKHAGSVSEMQKQLELISEWKQQLHQNREQWSHGYDVTLHYTEFIKTAGKHGGKHVV